MIKKISMSWAEFMITHGAKKEQKAVYVYGLECILNELLSDTLLLFFALFLGRVWEMLLWIVVFNLFRLNVGGCHASTSGRCILLSTALGVACVCLYPIIQGKPGLILTLMLFCSVIIFLIAPVINLKKRSVKKERIKKAWMISRVSAVLAAVVCIVLVVNDMKQVASMIVVSVLSVCLLALIGKYVQA